MNGLKEAGVCSDVCVSWGEEGQTRVLKIDCT